MKKLFLAFFVFTVLQLHGQSGNNPRIIAYYTGNGTAIQQYPVEKLTHIIFSFLRLKNDTLCFADENQRNSLQQLVALKKTYPQLKIMVSIGGWGGCAPCSELFSSDLHRRNFAKTTVALFREYNIDGIDLDWEYPVIEGYPGHRYDTADKASFTALVKALREEMGDRYLLSFAAGGFMHYLEQSIDWKEVTPQVDFINLMTYDLVSGFSTQTGHHTLLTGYRPGQQSIEQSVRWLLQEKIPSEKLIIGAAFYARVWENVPDSNQGLYQPGKFKTSVAYRNFTRYFNDNPGFTYYWDKKANAPYQYNREKKLFATFDDQRSIRAKSAFVLRHKLGGIMFWELSEDLTENGLVDAIYERLRKKR